jgi:hypothetical protein
MLKTIKDDYPEVVTTKDGVQHNMEHVDYTNGDSEDVPKESIFDPSSKNYDPVKDAK